MSPLKHITWIILLATAVILGVQMAYADTCTPSHAAVTDCNVDVQWAESADLPRMDADGDGIPNARDRCPNAFVLTPTGCPTDDYDSDGDGLPDMQDWCPYLSIGGITSGETGCPGQPTAEDPDGDGVIGDADLCPLVPGSSLADGCMDSDGDTFPDHLDECPFVPGVVHGCPDTDMDGFHDLIDTCPLQSAPDSADGCPPPYRNPRQFLHDRHSAVEHLQVVRLH